MPRSFLKQKLDSAIQREKSLPDNPAPRKVLQKRAALAVVGVLLLFHIYSLRLLLFYFDSLQDEEIIEQRVRPQREDTVTLFARRGSIVDRQGRILASENAVTRVTADPSQMGLKWEETAEVVARWLGEDPAKLKQIFQNKGCHYHLLSKKADALTVLEMFSELQERGLRGISTERAYDRNYEYEDLLGKIVGRIDHEGKGTSGVERSFYRELAGRDGKLERMVDYHGREVLDAPSRQTSPQDGFCVRLTIDVEVQQLVREELNAVRSELDPDKAVIVLMDPHMGDVLAMDYYSAEEIHRFPPTQDQFEPGSIFKFVTVAASVNEGLTNSQTLIDCENGHFTYYESELGDLGSYGDIPVEKILIKSSNIGTSKLAIQLGRQRLRDYLGRFGFGQRTGIRLPAEHAGQVRSAEKWQRASLLYLPIGQGVGVTPLQMCAAMSVVANGGFYMEPRIADAILTEEGKVIDRLPAVQRPRVLRHDTAVEVRKMLTKVVMEEGGTGQRARVPGFRVAGKTGTAQKPIPGGYSSTEFVTSFLGFMPADKPAFVMLVMIDAPKVEDPREYFGGFVAAPVFARLAEKLAKHFELEPTEPLDIELRTASAH